MDLLGGWSRMAFRLHVQLAAHEQLHHRQTSTGHYATLLVRQRPILYSYGTFSSRSCRTNASSWRLHSWCIQRDLHGFNSTWLGQLVTITKYPNTNGS